MLNTYVNIFQHPAFIFNLDVAVILGVLHIPRYTKTVVTLMYGMRLIHKRLPA